MHNCIRPLFPLILYLLPQILLYPYICLSDEILLIIGCFLIQSKDCKWWDTCTATPICLQLERYIITIHSSKVNVQTHHHYFCGLIWYPVVFFPPIVPLPLFIHSLLPLVVSNPTYTNTHYIHTMFSPTVLCGQCRSVCLTCERYF